MLQATAQRAVSNFLAAGSPFRDRAVKCLSVRGERAVPRAQPFKTRIGEIYDQNPDYRIAYVL